MARRRDMNENRKAGIWRRRLGRRAFVRGAAVAGAATGITSLAGCAGGGTPAAPTSAAGANVAPAATSAAPAAAVATAAPQIKYGGTYRFAIQSEANDLDPHLAGGLIGSLVYGPGIAYSKLLMYRADVKPPDTIPTGDLAESWEQPDERTYIFKTRKNAKWQNIAPVNGRAVVAEDVKLSYERQIGLKTNAARLPQLDKIEVVDPNTLKLTAVKPDADFLVSLAYTFNKIVPHESWELKGDLKEGPVIGSGPWIHDKWDKGQIATLNKNPDYYLKGFPRVDRVEIPRITDAATVISAFRGKEIDTITSSIITASDID